MQSMSNDLVAVAWISIAFMCPCAVGASPQENKELNFRYEVPPGFAKAQNSFEKTLHYFVKPNSDGTSTSLGITRMGGVVGRDFPSPPPEIPPGKIPAFPMGAHQTAERMAWRTFEIMVIRFDVHGTDLVVLGAEVPLKPEALQVQAMCTHAHEIDARAALSALVSSVDGATNWLSTEERVDKAAELLGVLVGALIGGILMWKIRRRIVSTGDETATNSKHS